MDNIKIKDVKLYKHNSLFYKSKPFSWPLPLKRLFLEVGSPYYSELPFAQYQSLYVRATELCSGLRRSVRYVVSCGGVCR
jgi:hypothetical protein